MMMMMMMTDVQLRGSFVDPRGFLLILDMKIFPSCDNWGRGGLRSFPMFWRRDSKWSPVCRIKVTPQATNGCD